MTAEELNTMKPMRQGAPTKAARVAMPLTPIAPPTLPDFARCDGCPAPAGVAVRLRDGAELLLCRNHARRHDLALAEQGAVIVGDYSLDANVQHRQGDEPSAASPGNGAAGVVARRWWQWLRPRRDSVPSRPTLHREAER